MESTPVGKLLQFLETDQLDAAWMELQQLSRSLYSSTHAIDGTKLHFPVDDICRNIAEQHGNLGIACFKVILLQEPNKTIVRENLAVALNRAGKKDEAEQEAKLACHQACEGCITYSLMLRAKGLSSEALDTLQGSLRECKQWTEGHFQWVQKNEVAAEPIPIHLSNVPNQLAKGSIDPEHRNVAQDWVCRSLLLMGNLFIHQKRPLAAAKSFALGKVWCPGESKFFQNLGYAYQQLGLTDIATKSAIQAIRDNPEDTLALSTVLNDAVNGKPVDKHDMEMAIGLGNKLMLKDVQVAEALGKVVIFSGDYEQGKAVLQNAFNHFGYNSSWQILCTIFNAAHAAADWETLQMAGSLVLPELLASPRKHLHCIQPLQIQMMPIGEESLRLLRDCTREWSVLWKDPSIESMQLAASKPLPLPEQFSAKLQAKSRDKAHVPTIGYLSSNLYSGAVWFMIRGLWKQHHDLKHTVLSFNTNPDTGTPAFSAKPAPMMALKDVKKYTSMHDIANMSFPQRAAAIRGEEVDFLIDINGLTAIPSLETLATRVAPVQATWMGYPGSLSIENVDYNIVDAIVVPPENAWAFSEKLFLLPHTYYVNNMRNLLPWLAQRHRYPKIYIDELRAAAGLPLSPSIVLVCFNRLVKIDPLVFATWMTVMKRNPNTHLWLFQDSKSPHAQDYIRKAMAEYGIEGTRVTFSGWMDWEGNVQRGVMADIFLDTPCYNAHSTGVNALWAGVPILTLAGETMASRVAASLDLSAGLPSMVARSPSEYLQMLSILVERPAVLQAVKETLWLSLRQASTRLWDQKGIVQALHRGAKIACDIFAANLRPMHIFVSPVGGGGE